MTARYCAGIFLTLAFFFVQHVDATEFMPWLGDPYVIEGRADLIVEAYESLNGKHGKSHRPACDFFLDAGASFTPDGEWSAELEAVLADTRHRSFGFDSLLLTGRHLFFNDIVGDPVSLSAGLTIIQAFKPAWHDISVFHHGGIACEGHVSVGKELSCQQFWTSRLWGVAAIGVGDVGSPWLRGDITWEHNWWDVHQLSLFAHTIWGLGGNTLNLSERFKGYGSLHHQSVDVGFRYTYGFEYGIAAHLDYAYRVFARNCPKNANFISVGLFYPF